MGKCYSTHERKQQQSTTTTDEVFIYNPSRLEPIREPPIGRVSSETNSSEMNTLENKSQHAFSEMITLEYKSQFACSEMITSEHKSQLDFSELNALENNSQDTDRLQGLVLSTNSRLNQRYFMVNVPIASGKRDSKRNFPNDNNYTPEGGVSTDSFP
ncbi:hypothetical protein MAR_015608 [Mya arenaria]|uniref:Uncharacterized protein n=1 Tax=Mya arenaria TaxID=6604 RepID=A0ABY7FL89_MYAAR|nr:hypothetical protein MAR_015608 [Mya arenaria]